MLVRLIAAYNQWFEKSPLIAGFAGCYLTFLPYFVVNLSVALSFALLGYSIVWGMVAGFVLALPLLPLSFLGFLCLLEAIIGPAFERPDDSNPFFRARRSICRIYGFSGPFKGIS